MQSPHVRNPDVTTLNGVYQALDRIQAMIEFDLAGHVQYANDVFLESTGYSRDEVIGQHHRMFCDAAYVRSAEYAAFWAQLASGQVHSGEFRRVHK